MTYNEWWNNVASAMQPLPDEDIEEFAHRMTALAWVNGENKEREACAKVCETLWDTAGNGMATEDAAYGNECATAIRAREQA
jgi:hypothetical protein